MREIVFSGGQLTRRILGYATDNESDPEPSENEIPA